MNGEQDTQGTLRDFLNVIFKYKTKIAAIFLAVVGTVTIGSFVMPPTYEASSKILVKFGRENVYATTTQTGGSPPVVFDTAREERINSEVELLTGRVLIGKVISDIGVDKIYPAIWEDYLKDKTYPALDNAVLVFEKKLTVEAVKKADIITVSFRHKNPVIAAQVVNKLAERFIEYHVSVHKQPQQGAFFDEQVKLQGDKLRESETAFQGFRTKTNVAALKEQRELLLKQISETEMGLSKVRSDIGETGGRLRAMEGRPASAGSPTQFGQETELNPYATSSIRIRLTELRLKEQELLNRYSEKNALVVNIRKEIEEAKQILEREEQTFSDKIVVTLSDNLKALKSKEESLKRDMGRYQQELNRINGVEMKTTELERTLKLDDDNYQLYIKKVEEARITNAMDNQRMVNVSVAEPALPPIKPVKPKILLNILLSIVLGAVSALGAAFFSEYLGHTFNNKEDVEKYLDLPLLTSITAPKA